MIPIWLTEAQQQDLDDLYGPKRNREEQTMAIDLRQEAVRLKKLIDMGMASPDEVELYNRIQGRSGQSSPNGASQEEPQDMMTVKVNQEAFERGWSSGGSTPPEKAGIFAGTCDSLEASRTDPGSYFAWFKAKGIEPGTDGYWRGALTIDKVADADGRAGKLKDLLLALGLAYKLGRGQVIFPNPRGAEADCDWQMVDIKGQKQLRIQGVYPMGERKQSV